jgi:hypothetical protein
MRDAMLPRAPLPRPENAEKESKPLSGVFPGAAEPAKKQ